MFITYFVHSTTTDNEAGLATGWINCKLSEKGLRQAHELRGLITAPAQGNFDGIWASDLDRAVDTASIAFAPARVRTDWRLREINYGRLNGSPSSAVKRNLMEYVNSPFPEGESYSDVTARVLDFLQDLKKDSSRKAVAIVAHQAPQLALDVLLKHKSWEDAFRDDWRNTSDWRPGWEYEV